MLSVSDCSVPPTVVALKDGNIVPEEHPTKGCAVSIEAAAEHDDVVKTTDNPMSERLGASLLPITL